MSEIQNNLNEPFQAQNNGQNQITINGPIQNNFSEPYTVSQAIYQEQPAPAFNCINEENKPSLNKIVEQQNNSEIINNQNTNIPIQEEEKKIFIPTPFSNNDINEPIETPQNINNQPYETINQNLNYAQLNIPFTNEPFMNPQINNQGQNPQNYQNIIGRKKPPSDFDVICPSTACGIFCIICLTSVCITIFVIFGLFIYLLSKLF